MARWLGLSALALGVGLGVACGSSLPTPDVKAHPPLTTKDIEVPYPPPAARPEIIPPKPREGAVWVDGEWSWQGKQWTWESGGWVMPPARAYFSPWIVFRQANGTLRFTPGTWHKDDGQPLPRPTPLALAQTSLEDEGQGAKGDAGGGP